MKNCLAEIWYQCIIHGTKSIDECPETRNGEPLKSVVVDLLKSYGYDNLVTE